MLIGLTGRNASGKSTIVNWFSKKGLETSSCSDSIRAWLAEQNIEPTRDALIEGGRELRRKGGAGILAEMLLEILDGKDAVVDSIRTPGEVEALRKRDDFILIEVRANTETRWKRLQSRARTGDPLDKETFLKQERAEAEAKDDAGQALNATAELADLVILNDGTEKELLDDLEELYQKLDSFSDIRKMIYQLNITGIIMRRLGLCLAILLVIIASSNVQAAEVPPKPDEEGIWVIDSAQVLSSTQFDILNEKCNQIYLESGKPIVVLTIESYQDQGAEGWDKENTLDLLSMNMELMMIITKIKQY